MMKIALSELQFYLMPGAGPTDAHRNTYLSTYNTWKLVWEETLSELAGQKKIYSDGFTRQTKIGTLHYRSQCIALVTIRETNLLNLNHREDSLLSAWSQTAIEKLISQGPKVAIGSYLTVHPDFRGEIASDVTLKLLTAFMTTKMFLASDCDVLTGTMRVNRGTDKSASAVGGTLVERSQMYGVEADLFAYYRTQTIKDADQVPACAAQRWADELWNQRVDLFAAPPLRLVKTKAA